MRSILRYVSVHHFVCAPNQRAARLCPWKSANPRFLRVLSSDRTVVCGTDNGMTWHNSSILAPVATLSSICFLRSARLCSRSNLSHKVCCHTFRATGITAYLENGGTIKNAQAIAAHESPRTTKLYDRTADEITLDEVERIRI